MPPRSADWYQSRHNVPRALIERIAEVSRVPTCQGYHQLGVLLSELGESMRYIAPKDTQRAEAFLQAALRAFAGAISLIQGYSVESRLTALAIECDKAIAEARLMRYGNEGTKDFYDLCLALDDRLFRMAKCRTERPDQAASVRHQLAIGYAFLARLASGELLDFPAPPRPDDAENYYDQALKRFDEERFYSPDGERALRSFWYALALAYPKQRRRLTRRMRISARYNRHQADYVRATLLGLFGKKTEKWLRIMRDRKIVSLNLDTLPL